MAEKDDKSIIHDFLPVAEKDDGTKLGLCQGLDEEGNPAQSLTVIAPIEEGKPIQSDVYQLESQEGSPAMKATRLLRVSHAGPPQVASKAYLDNFDKIFRKKKEEGAEEPDPSTLN